MRIALRIEVRSLRGLREGVPNLMRLFSDYQVRASFLFALGDDCSGRDPRGVWRRTGLRDLNAYLRGTILPASSMATAAAHWMRTAQQNGHETGLLGLSPWMWRRRLARADPAWVDMQWDHMTALFEQLGGTWPTIMAAPDWQLNPSLLEHLSTKHCQFSTFTRGRMPFYPVLQGIRSTVVEMPTTLPTVDEMLHQHEVSPENVHEFLYAESRRLLPAGHVFSLDAEEGVERISLMEKLLVMWRGQDGSVRALGDLLKEIELSSLPYHQVGWGKVAGREGYVAMQSIEVPA